MNINATFLGQAIAFILFVLLCMKYIWPPLMAAIEKRQKEIADGLVFAERAKKDLDIAQVDAINHLKEAKIKAQEIIEEAKKLKTKIVDDAKIAAKVEYNKILAQAQTEIEAECRRTREELRKKVAMLVLSGAEKIIERSVDAATNSDIIDKIISEL